VGERAVGRPVADAPWDQGGRHGRQNALTNAV
jgi:hypothetical protein